MWIVLLGCHGAGKTTLGKELARLTGWAFHEELGRTLAADPRWRPAGQTASGSQQSFDSELMARELRRDRAWPASTPRIIETWHPGNLAYAGQRGSKVSPEHLGHIQKICREQRVLVLPVLAPREVLEQRRSEASEIDFFLAVAGSALSQVEALGLAMLPPAWTHLDTPSRLASRIAPRLLGQIRKHRRVTLSQGHSG